MIGKDKKNVKKKDIYYTKDNLKNNNYKKSTYVETHKNKINVNNSIKNNDNYNSKRKTNIKTNINKNAKNFNLEKLEVPDSIFEFLIRFYFLNENLKDKIKKKIATSEEYYIINYEFINNIQKLYNYNQIKKELENFKYISEKNLDNKILDIINSIKKKAIIKDIIPMDDIQIIPRIEELYLIRQYVDFCLVNEEIIETIKTIQKDFKLKRPVSQNKHSFYFKPQLFYKGKDYIKIGELNENCYFELHYFINVDLYKCNFNNLLKEINNSNSIKEFFKRKNIDIDAIEMQDLIDYSKIQGKIYNFKYKNQNFISNDFPVEQKLRSNVKKTTNTKSNIKANDSKDNNIKQYYIPEELEEPPDDFIRTDLSYLDNFKIKSFHEIQNTPMIGLQNIGQTCYMNAALQCFSNTKALTSYFLNYNNLKYLKNNAIILKQANEPSLVIEYLKLIRHLWCDPPKSYYAPYEFKKEIGKIDSLFKNFEANDAKDFVNFLVMRLHDELNGIDGTLIKEKINEPSMQLNPYNQMQVLQSYLYEFQINFNSFISNCFYGTTQGEFECQNCKMKLYQTGQNLPLIKYNYQTFFFLNFPLGEVSKYILSNQMIYMKYMNANVNPNRAVDLMDCFSYYQKDEILGCYCDGCQNNNAQVVSRTKLYVAPIYLIILLNRGKGIEFNIKIMFPEFFDTKGIFINPTGVYQLYGVVKHFGESSSAGHFTAYCRSPIDNRWYFYNDATVTPVDEREKYRIQEEGLTYMLFYSKMNNK